MGDLGMYVTYDEDPWNRTYTTRGRKEIDWLRIPGGQLYAAEFERAFIMFSDIVAPDFELHYPQDARVGERKMELWVIAETSFDPSEFIANFMREVRVSPNSTYADVVARKLVCPMTCKVVDRLSREGEKRRRFVPDI